MTAPCPLALTAALAAQIAATAAGCTRYEVAVLAGDGGAGAADADAPRGDGPPPTGFHLDPTFGPRGDGVLPVELAASDDEIVALALRAEGGLVALARADCALVALTPQGQPDPKFGTLGVTRYATTASTCTGAALLVDGASRYVVGGSTADPGARGLVVRYRKDGTPDPTFGPSHGVLLKEQSAVVALAPDAGGRIVALAARGGTTKEDTGDLSLLRIEPTGAVDTAFGGGPQTGRFSSPGIDTPVAIGTLSRGGFGYVGGQSSAGGAQEIALARFGADGALAPFGPDRWILLPVRRGSQVAHAVPLAAAWGADDALVFAGQVAEAPSNDRAGTDLLVGRVDFGGKRDLRFGAEGLAILDGASGGFEAIAAIALEPGGKILAVGSRRPTGGPSEGFVLRLLASGAPDPHFGDGGFVALRFAAVVEASSVALQPDGKILVGGTAGAGGSGLSSFVARLTP